jgi:RNA polymerase sigma factor (sigma-70 family)
VVQEVFARCVSALAEFEPRGIGSFWGFLRKIASNYMIDLARRRGAQPVEPLASASSLAPSTLEQSPLSRLVGAEEVRAFETALATLPAKQRDALLMRIELDLDYRTIARDCGYPSPEAARMSITRALQDLCREMTRGAGGE